MPAIVDYDPSGGSGPSSSSGGAATPSGARQAPNYAQIGQGLGGVVQDIGQYVAAQHTKASEEAAAAGFGEAAQLAFENEQEAGAAGKLQQIQNTRAVYKIGAAGAANAASNGVRMEGSAASILRNITAQGQLANQLIGTQTQINVNGYIGQMQADYVEQAQAEEAEKAAKSSGTMALIGAGVGLVSTVAQAASGGGGGA